MSSIMKTHTSFRTTPQEIGRHRNAADALKAAGLDFTVDSVPMSHLDIMSPKYSEKYYVAKRSTDGAYLGVNSKQFHHYQPAVLGTLAEAIIKVRPDAYISAGGLSKDERTQFLVVTLDDAPLDGPQGKHNRNVMLVNGTNGNRVLQGIAFDFTFFCMNQFPAVLRSGSKLFRLGHNFTDSMALPTAVQAVQDATRVFDDLDREIETLLSAKVSEDNARSTLLAVAGKEPDATEQPRAFNLWRDRFVGMMSEYCSPHNDYAFGSAWGLVMAAQALDEHGSKCAKGVAARDQQRMTRVVANDYPHMAKALELVTLHS